MFFCTFPLKKHNQQHLDLWPAHPCFFWSRTPFPHPLRRLHLGFNIIPINPRLISCYDVLKKVFITICIASSSKLISTRCSFWSSVNKRGTNFTLTRRIWSFSAKIWWQDPVLIPTSSATFLIVKRRFPRITTRTISTWSLFVDVEGHPGLGSSPTDIALFKTLKSLIAQR